MYVFSICRWDFYFQPLPTCSVNWYKNLILAAKARNNVPNKLLTSVVFSILQDEVVQRMHEDAIYFKRFPHCNFQKEKVHLNCPNELHLLQKSVIAQQMVTITVVWLSSELFFCVWITSFFLSYISLLSSNVWVWILTKVSSR